MELVPLCHQCVPNHLPFTGLPFSLVIAWQLWHFRRWSVWLKGNTLDDRGGWPGCGLRDGGQGD